MSVVEQEFPGTTPEYTTEAEYLAEKMRHFSASELEKMLKISPKLAAENYERYQRFWFTFESSQTGFVCL